jgi:O-antigen/teichoic acid export membrane protein
MNAHDAKNYVIHWQKKISILISAYVQSSIVKNFFIYSCGHIILRSISILMMPFALALLSPSQYGLLSLAISFANIFIVFLSFGLRQVFAIEYFHHDEQGQKRILNEIITLFIFFALPILFICSFNIHAINSMIFVGQASNQLIALTLIFCFFYFFSELFYQVLQYQCKAFELTLLQSSVAVLTILTNIAFLFLCRWGIEGMMAGYIIGLIVVFCIAAMHYVQNKYYESLDIKKSLSLFSHYLKAGFPFIPNVLFSWLLSYGNRWILAHYASLHDVGIFALADTFSSLYQMLIIYPLSCSYLPILFKRYADNKENILLVEQWNKKNMYICMIVMAIIVTIGYGICKPFALKILPFKYHEALSYGWFILMGNIFLMGVTFASTLIQFYKKTYFLALAICFPALLNIVLNIILIPYWGIYGSVWATMISYICYFGLILGYNNHLSRH